MRERSSSLSVLPTSSMSQGGQARAELFMERFREKAHSFARFDGGAGKDDPAHSVPSACAERSTSIPSIAGTRCDLKPESCLMQDEPGGRVILY